MGWKEDARDRLVEVGINLAVQKTVEGIEWLAGSGERKRAREAAERRTKAIKNLTVVLVIAGIGTGGFFLAKKMFFSKPNTVVESVAVAEAAPEAVTITETPEQEPPAEVTASETVPAAKTGFFYKIGEFFVRIGRAIKGFFIMVWNAIKTFFITVGSFFARIFGKLTGLFHKGGG